MSLTALLRLALAAGKEAVGKFKDVVSGEFNSLKRIFMIAAVVIFLFSLPGIFLEGMFGWMGSADEESLQIDVSGYDSILDSKIIPILTYPYYPDNIPWPATSLQTIGKFSKLDWSEIEMCNVIYQAYLVDSEDNGKEILEKYTKIVSCFSKATQEKPYWVLVEENFGVKLTDDEIELLNDECNYHAPWEKK